MGDFDWQIDWQLVVALVAVAAAALFLGRRVRRLVKGNKGTGDGCGTGGCGSCSANSASKQEGLELPLVTLENTRNDDS